MAAAGHDEYQDGASPGSLASACRHWLELQAARALVHPQQFTFAFACPTRRMAFGLADFLVYGPHAGYAHARDGDALAAAWLVSGTTRPRCQSLPRLEHLFMDLRQAAARYESQLVTLHLLPAWPGRRVGR
jgi:hypothetical protein